MSLKKGDYIIFRYYYKHPGVHGYVWCEALGKVIGQDGWRGYSNYRVWNFSIKSDVTMSESAFIRMANALEILAIEVSR